MNDSLSERYLSAKRRLFERCYSYLNKPQREAVFTANGALLVLAGAGSGKTTVLVRRIVYLIRYGNAYFSTFVPPTITEERVAELEAAEKLPVEEIEPILSEFISAPCAPWNMLAITFTNKAANEIKSRLATTLEDPEVAKSVWAGTFHSVCMRILRVWGGSLGYRENFTVYDTSDTKATLSAAMKELGFEEKTLPVKGVMNEIGRAKDQLISAEQYEKEYGIQDFRHRRIAAVYKKYQEKLMAANALDFDDIIMQTVKLLEENQEAREYYQNKFRYVCVDEFQDTNVAQFRLTALLAGGHHNLMVVGDDDQSIYRFRGAVIGNILGFDRSFPDTKVIKLEQNYRSTGVILEAANSVILHNQGRRGKNLWTDRRGGDKINLRVCDDPNAEARYIGDKIQTHVAAGSCHFRDVAILYRTNAQSRALEQVFSRSGIPYRILGGLRFNDRKEIRDLVAYLQVIVNPSDTERFRRIVNEPKRAIGEKTVDAVLALAVENQKDVLEIMENAADYPALGRSAQKLVRFAGMIAGLAELLNTDITLEAFVGQVLDKTGYRQMLIEGGEAEAERLENINEFIAGVAEYEKNSDEPTLPGFLEENALVADVDKYDENADAVVMMTVHSAKGLEFPIVFLPGMEDNIFPGSQNILSGDPEDMEEERRLAYVAITRAKEELYITRARTRMLYGRTSVNPPSRFLEEIPAELVREDVPQEAFYGMPRKRVYFSASEEEHQTPAKRSGVQDDLFAPRPQPKVQKQPQLREGDRVRHITFGEGEVLSVKPMGGDVLYEVMFDRAGTKRLMGNYAKLKKLD